MSRVQKETERQVNVELLQSAVRKRVRALSGRGPDALAPNDVEMPDGSIQTQEDSFRAIMKRNNWPHDLAKQAEALRGGLADGLSDKDFNAKALAAGRKAEREHTTDRKVAQEIARDHLKEDPEYYQKLKKIEKAAGYAMGSVRSAGEVGRRVLPAWSKSVKTPPGARRAATMISKQPYAPGGPKSLISAASASNRKPLATLPNMKTAALLDAFVERLEKEAGITDWGKSQVAKVKKIKPASVAKGVAGFGKDIVSFGIGEGVASKILPRWQPKVAGLDKEALGPLALLMGVPLAIDAAKAAGRLSKKPGKALAAGLGPKVRPANTPEVQKIAFWATAARLTAKYAPKLLNSVGAKKTATRAAGMTAKGLTAGTKRFAVSAGKDAALGGGLMLGANALSHVGRPKPSVTPR